QRGQFGFRVSGESVPSEKLGPCCEFFHPPGVRSNAFWLVLHHIRCVFRFESEFVFAGVCLMVRKRLQLLTPWWDCPCAQPVRCADELPFICQALVRPSGNISIRLV